MALRIALRKFLRPNVRLLSVVLSSLIVICKVIFMDQFLSASTPVSSLKVTSLTVREMLHPKIEWLPPLDHLSDSAFIDDIDNMARCFDRTTKLRFRNVNEPQFIKFGSTRDNEPESDIRYGQLKLMG